jgi:NAD dependent epimerase/dehydratase family enzyme
LKPVLEERKKYYEKNFKKELDKRWENLRQKLQKKFKRADVVLPLIYTQDVDAS